MDDNQTILDDSLEQTMDEGGIEADQVDSEELTEDEQERETPSAPKTPLQGMIEAQAQRYADAETEYDREVILEKFPKIKNRVQKLGDDLIEQLTESQEPEDKEDIDSIAEKAAKLLEEKGNLKKIKDLLIRKGFKGQETINKLTKAAKSLIENGFSVENSIEAVTVAKKSQPAIPRSNVSPGREAPKKKQSLFTKSVPPSEWY